MIFYARCGQAGRPQAGGRGRPWLWRLGIHDQDFMAALASVKDGRGLL